MGTVSIESWDHMETTPVDEWFSDKPRVPELVYSIQVWTLAVLRGCGAAELARRVNARNPQHTLHAVHLFHRTTKDIQEGWQRVGVTVGGFTMPADSSTDEAMHVVSRMLEEAVFMPVP